MQKQPQDDRARYERWCLRAMVLVLSVLVMVGVLSFFLPKPTFSEYEKRELTPMPEFSAQALFSSRYLRDFETHYADTFPARDLLIQLAAGIEECKGVRGADDVKLYEGTGSQPSQPPESSSTPPVNDEPPQSSSSQPEKPPAPQTDGYITEGCFISGDRGMYLFGGYRPVATLYAQYLTNFAGRVGDGVSVYNIVVPTAAEFYLPEKYSNLSASQKDNIAYLYSQLGDGVTGVDAWSELCRHTDEYLYFRTDHHWTAMGAYCAYVAYCEAAGLAPVSLEGLEKRTIQPFRGTIYNETRDQRLWNNPDYVDYYIVTEDYTATLTQKGGNQLKVPAWAEFASGSNAYSVFIYADNPLFEIDTGIDDGSSVLVLKESYGNAFVPFLMANYDKIYVIDYRHYERSVYDFVVEHQIQNVIFINNAFAANTEYHASRINYLCNSAVVTAPVNPAPQKQPSESDQPSSSSSAEEPAQSSESESSRAPLKPLPPEEIEEDDDE